MIKPYKHSHLIFKRHCLARLYTIDQYIRSEKYPNIIKLAETLEVRPRTVERDIEHMRDMLGACITYDRRRKGYYYTSNEFKLPPLKLTEDEAATLFLGQQLLARCAGTPFENIIRSTFEKICAQLPVSFSADSSLIDKTVSFGITPLRGDDKKLAGYFGRLAEAIVSKTRVRIEYFSPSKQQITQRNVDPYHLRYYQGAWYLIGYCQLRENIRIFALDRILDLKETEQCYEISPSFSLQEFLSSSMGIEAGDNPEEIAIQFDNFQSRYIRERTWHESQRFEEKNDGSLVLHLKVSGLGEVKRWILGFGSHAEVLSPKHLRDEVKEEIRKAWEMY